MDTSVTCMREHPPSETRIRHPQLDASGVAPMSQRGERRLGAIDGDEVRCGCR
jgi:hypothetical protein